MTAVADKLAWNETLPFDPSEIGVDSEQEESVRKYGWKVAIDTLLDLHDLDDDWDGYGALAPAKDILKSAFHLAIHFRDLGMREPDGIIPGVNGTILSIGREWIRSYLEVEVTKPFQAECIFIAPGKPTQTWTFNRQNSGLAA